jgi:DNA gyrase subunit A
MVVVKQNGTLLAICENGYGKRTSVDSYPVKNRGTKGVITIKTSARNGYLVALLEVLDTDDLMIVTKDGMILRHSIKEMSIISRNTQGVRLVSLKKNDKVFDVTCISSEKDDEDETEEVKPAPVNSLKEENTTMTDENEQEVTTEEQVTLDFNKKKKKGKDE